MTKFFVSFILGIVVAYIYEVFGRMIGINVFKRDALIISSYKLHHSLYGVLFLMLANINKSIFLTGFGLGIIVQHTFTDGFRFIQKIWEPKI